MQKPKLLLSIICAVLKLEFLQQLIPCLIKVNEFIEKHDLDWTRGKSVTTDGAAAMQGCTNGVKKKKKISGMCFKSLHDTERSPRCQKIKP